MDTTERMAMSIAKEPYYRGLMTRTNAEEILRVEPPGKFIFRRSETREGLSLSVRVKDKIKHYMVTAREDGRYVVVGKDKDFGTIQELVEFHSKVPPSESDDDDWGVVNSDDPYVQLVGGEVNLAVRQEVANQAKARLQQHSSATDVTARASGGARQYEDGFVPLKAPK